MLWSVLGQAFGSVGLVLAHIWEDVGSVAQMEAEELLGSTAGAERGERSGKSGPAGCPPQPILSQDILDRAKEAEANPSRSSHLPAN